MQFIPSRIHGAIDYIVGVVLILAPFLFNFALGGAEMWVPIIIGAAIILYSLFTNYELGAVRRITLPSHLGVDALAGVILAVSPWLFAFSAIVWVPHLLVGLLLIGIAAFTVREPVEAKPRTRRTRATRTPTTT